ncbi:hypothetical protein A0H81_04888 [Grifola frondosa]|uniref:Uncharacterized protein n=1 Tax=Grifola frondosa TaxID=5627 RepID=A0A1C7MGM4_GRIFR|nr:hypothetical protein A0H81_04888 [Grifola frondosa]
MANMAAAQTYLLRSTHDDSTLLGIDQAPLSRRSGPRARGHREHRALPLFSSYLSLLDDVASPRLSQPSSPLLHYIRRILTLRVPSTLFQPLRETAYHIRVAIFQRVSFPESSRVAPAVPVLRDIFFPIFITFYHENLARRHTTGP